MSTTRELEQAFESKRPPDQIKMIAVRQFEPSDPNDMESPLIELLPQEVSASYCWRIDIAGVSYWTSQVNGEEMFAVLKPTAEEEDQDKVVGMLTKIEPDGKTRRYGPVELLAKPWQKLQAAGILI